MRRVLQEHRTGCGLACVAMIIGSSYSKVYKIAKKQIKGMSDDQNLYTDAKELIELLSILKVASSQKKIPFKSIETLPDKAILAVNHSVETGYWHWVVFKREQNGFHYILDPKVKIKTEKRVDFGRLKPKWYIKIST